MQSTRRHEHHHHHHHQKPHRSKQGRRRNYFDDYDYEIDDNNNNVGGDRYFYGNTNGGVIEDDTEGLNACYCCGHWCVFRWCYVFLVCILGMLLVGLIVSMIMQWIWFTHHTSHAKDDLRKLNASLQPRLLALETSEEIRRCLEQEVLQFPYAIISNDVLTKFNEDSGDYCRWDSDVGDLALLCIENNVCEHGLVRVVLFLPNETLTTVFGTSEAAVDLVGIVGTRLDGGVPHYDGAVFDTNKYYSMAFDVSYWEIGGGVDWTEVLSDPTTDDVRVALQSRLNTFMYIKGSSLSETTQWVGSSMSQRLVDSPDWAAAQCCSLWGWRVLLRLGAIEREIVFN